jgi:hypothetical protein
VKKSPVVRLKKNMDDSPTQFRTLPVNKKTYTTVTPQQLPLNPFTSYL